MNTPHSLDHDGLDGVLPATREPFLLKKTLIWILLAILLALFFIALWFIQPQAVSAPPILIKAESAKDIKDTLTVIKPEKINSLKTLPPILSTTPLVIQDKEQLKPHTTSDNSNNIPLNESKNSASSTSDHSLNKQANLDTVAPIPVDKNNSNYVVVTNIMQAILFKHSSSKIKALSADETKHLNNIVNGCDSVIIIGHTCNQGPSAFNYQLGLARAKSMSQYLINQGSSKDIFTVRSEGMDKPVASNATRSGRKLNRRIELRCEMNKDADLQ